MSLKSLCHVGIVVSDLDLLRHFYCDLLGFLLQKEEDEGGEHLEKLFAVKDVRVRRLNLIAPSGKGALELIYYYQPKPLELEQSFCQKGRMHIALELEDCLQSYLFLRDNGVRFLSTPQKSPDKRSLLAFCQDYEGNLLKLFEVL